MSGIFFIYGIKDICMRVVYVFALWTILAWVDHIVWVVFIPLWAYDRMIVMSVDAGGVFSYLLSFCFVWLIFSLFSLQYEWYFSINTLCVFALWTVARCRRLWRTEEMCVWTVVAFGMVLALGAFFALRSSRWMICLKRHLAHAVSAVFVCCERSSPCKRSSYSPKC